MEARNLILLFLFVAVLIIPGCQKEDKIPQNTPAPSGAKLKRILIYPGIDASAPEYIESEYEYDSLGRISRVNHPMYEDGVMSGPGEYEKYSYNDQGLPGKISSYVYNATPGIGYVNLINSYYYYSKDGKLMKISTGHDLSPESAGYDLYHYENGMLDKIGTYTSADTLESYIHYEYNSSDELVKESKYSRDGEFLEYTLHSYSNGLQVLSEVYTTFHEVFMIRKIERTFDSNGNLDILVSRELAPWSSRMSYKMKYEYF